MDLKVGMLSNDLNVAVGDGEPKYPPPFAPFQNNLVHFESHIESKISIFLLFFFAEVAFFSELNIEKT